jgi:tetratricopeptide (TPR) repeat protein
MDQQTIQNTLAFAVQHHQAGRLGEAENYYRQVLALQPDHADALHMLGVVAGQMGRPDAAVELIRRALAVNHNLPKAHSNLGNYLRQMGQLDAAIDACRDAIALRADYPEAYNNLGNALREKGEMDGAIAAYGQAIAFRSNYAEAHNNLGNALRENGRVDEAIAAIRRAIAINPKFPGAYSNLGNALKDKGEVDDAIAAYRQEIALRPGSAMALLNLGQLFRERGRPGEALSAFQQAAQCEPGNSDAHNCVASVLAELQRFDEAKIALDRAAALAPDSARTHEARGAILWRSGHGAEAVESFRRALEIAPESMSVWIDLGNALRQIGRFSEAADCFRHILALRPDAVGALGLMASVGEKGDAGEISRLAASVDDPRTAIGDRAALGFALGKMLDDADRFDEAFARYAEANSRTLEMRQANGERYDGEAFSRRVDESVAMFTRDFFLRVRGWGETSELPVFIVGMPRSGTSLVEQIAASHPDVFGAGELRDIGDLAKSLNLSQCETGSVKDAACKQLNRLRGLGGSALRVIDKMPSNVEHLGLIATLFPSARIIICRRDARDTCLSCFFQQFSTGNLFSFDLGQCGRHHVETDRLIAHWVKVLPLQMLEMQYEELVADLEGQSRRIIDFLGLPWNAACLDFHRTERTVMTSSDWQVRQPIYTRSVGRWRNYEGHLGPLVDALGMGR